jgi:hypothetical protein
LAVGTGAQTPGGVRGTVDISIASDVGPLAIHQYVNGNVSAAIKTHARNIYRKLGVAERGEAIARARDLGLI